MSDLFPDSSDYLSMLFPDSSDYLIVAYTNLGRQFACCGYWTEFYEWEWDGDGGGLSREDIDNFGQNGRDIEYCAIARKIQENFEVYTDNEDEDEDDEDEDDNVTAQKGEIITKVTLFEIKRLYREGELGIDKSTVIGFRVAKALSYFRPFVVD